MISTSPHQVRTFPTPEEINRRWRAEIKRGDELAGALDLQLAINDGLRAEIERLTRGERR